MHVCGHSARWLALQTRNCTLLWRRIAEKAVDDHSCVHTIHVTVVATECIQSAPPTPPKQLRGFEKLKLSPGQAGTATFEITRRDLSYWDTESQKWVVPSGSFKVFVGASSRDIRQQGTFTV